jgi:radical SAM superfamily enzyme YgiQ (UPF0313 family)
MARGKDLLLVDPWIHDFTAYDFWMKPLGLLYVASLLRRHTPHRVSFVDCLDRFHPSLARRAGRPDGRGPFPKEEIPKPAAVRDVPRRFSRYGLPVRLFDEELARAPRPDAVLVTSVMTYWYPGVQLAIELVRRRFGRVPVVLGGIYASLCPEHARAESGADLVAPGPAEEALWPALAEVLGGASPAVPDLSGPDPLPAPAFDLLRDRTWLPVLTSRGCPMRCTFCASSLLAPGFTQRPPAAVLAEIARSHARFGTRHFAFYDDALLAGKTGHAWPLFEGLAAGPRLSFHTPNGLHVREIDRPTARLMRAAGLSSLSLSLESADEAFVRDRCPKASPRDLEAALRALEAAGYERKTIGVYLIVGLPGQPAAGIAESAAFVRSLGAVPRVAYFSPIPGTPEWAGLVGAGILDEGTDPLLHNKTAFAYLKSGLPPSEVRRLLGSPGSGPA